MKAVVQILFSLFLLSLFAGAIVAKPEFPAYIGHVNDFANVLDASTKQTLETILTNFESRTGAQLAVVTITTLAEQPIEEYANGLYRAWGVGEKTGANKNKGALLLIATQDRRSRLEVGYGLEGDLPDGLAGEMLRRMRPFFREQRWSEGVSLGVNTLVATLAQKWNISIEGIDQELAYQGTSDQEQASPVGFVAAIIFLIIFFIIISRIARRGGGGPGAVSWAGPLIFGRGGGGFGGGSWGSSSGGGTGGSDWGGFGGGSSGGGGASDSW
jgi:uncharacterized protein